MYGKRIGVLRSHFMERLGSVNKEFLNVNHIEVCGKRIGVLHSHFMERLGNVKKNMKY